MTPSRGVSPGGARAGHRSPDGVRAGAVKVGAPAGMVVAGAVLGCSALRGTAPGALVAGVASAVAGALLIGPDPGDRLRRCLGAPSRTVPLRWLGARWLGARPGGSLPDRGGGPAAGVPVPVVIDLVAAVIEAGVPPDAAVRLVSRSLSDAGDPAGSALASGDGRTRSWHPLFAALDLARVSGLGPVGLLRAAAQEQRRHRAEALAVAARRLAVLAVLPTSLCLLPAFVLLTVVPLILGLLTG